MTTAQATGRAGIGAPGRARVLVLADSQSATLVEALTRHGHDVQSCDSAEKGCAALAESRHDIAFVDVSMTEPFTGVAADLGIPLVVLGSAPGPVPSRCLGLLAHGAAAAAAAMVVDLVVEKEHLRLRCQDLDVLVGGIRDGSAMVGRSPLMRRLQSALARAADSDATVLVEGAVGSGKSLAARVIHCKSRRGTKPLVVHGAADLDGESLQQAFTDARGSTIVIEDVEQLPMAGQQVLVKFLKERSSGNSGAPARLVATTSAHLPELVARGAFREDLYYRLHAYPIVMPALRERTEDIPLLARALLDQLGSSAGNRAPGFTPAALILLESMSWPGNVAQLENVVRRAFVAAGGASIDSAHLLGPSITQMPAAVADMVEPEAVEGLTEAAIRPFEEEEQRLLSRALRATRGNVRRAAQLLGIGRATLYRKIQQYKLRLQ